MVGDHTLAARAAGGDCEAFGQLVRRHGPAVRGLLRRMGAEAALADDLAQDAFVAGFQHIREFRGEGAFAGWIKRIAARRYIRHVRGRIRLETSLEEADLDWEQGGGEAVAATSLDLDAALKSLSEAERLCISLCHGAGLSHGEIAEALKTPLGTVKSHIRRGLDKLRRHMGVEMRSGTDG